MRIEVLTTRWGADDAVYDGGSHEIEKPTAKFLRLVAGAEAAGVVKVTASQEERAKLRGHVESQADSEKAQEKAFRSGAWHEGNLADYIDSKSRLAQDDSLPAEFRASLAAGIEQAERLQQLIAGGASYDAAAAEVTGG